MHKPRKEEHPLRSHLCATAECGRAFCDPTAREDDVDLQPPSGSRISVTTDGGCPVIVIPPGNGGPMRYFMGLFTVFWLGGWYWGLRTALSQVWSGKAPAFVIFWLVAWTLAGVYAMYMVYRALRPSVPESLKLMANGVSYDSGVPPLQPSFGYASRSRSDWRSLFPKRTRLEIDWQNLQSLRLRATNGGNRLTVDVGVLRIDIAGSAGEIEREWLYQLLAKRYSLAPEKNSADRGSG